MAEQQPCQNTRAFDWALLLIPLIGLVAVWPLLTRSMPNTDDGTLFKLRVVELDRLLRHTSLSEWGDIWPPRWAPDFAHGYGYPIFNYYASLSSYIAEFWHALGLDFSPAIAAATISAFFVSGWGAYLLGRDIAGRGALARLAGLVAATAYMYAPYQFYDSVYRGNLAETWALALLPWVLWSARRAATRRRWPDIVPCAVAYAALIYTHNVYTLLASPLLGIYLLFLWSKNGHTWRDALRLGAAITLGLALSAFFWLPMFFEKEWTHFSTDLVDYRTFFLPLRELLARPPQVDLSLLNDYPPRSLSWGMLILTGLHVGASLLPRARQKPRIASSEWAFFLLILVLAALMTIRPSDFLWRTVPLLNLAFIPWRYLGIASLAGGLVAGSAITHLADRPTLKSPALIGAGAAITLLILTAVPWTYATPFPQTPNIGLPEMMRWEYDTGLIGTTAKNEYLPIWAQMPDQVADPSLLTDHDPIIARLDQDTLPGGATIVSARYSLLRADLTIDTPLAFRAIYKQFYFPGWRVEIDGQAVPQIITQPYGLLGFDVPAGRRHIVIRPGRTLLGRVGETISVLAALVAVGLAANGASRRRTRCIPPAKRRARPAHLIATAVLSLALLALKEGIIDRTDNPFRAHRFDGAHAPGAQTQTQINLGNMLTLHGYDLPARPTRSGKALRVDLYLSARRRPVDGNYMAYARLVDEQGRLWSQPDNGAPEGFRPPPPTTLWTPDAYGHWSYLTYILPGTPPGEYWIEIAVFERGTWRGLNVLDEQGRIIGQKTTIGPVQITGPRMPPPLDALDIEQPQRVSVDGALYSLGSALHSSRVRPGERIDLTLFWQAVQQIERDYRLRLDLVSKSNTYFVAGELALGRATHPTTRWQKGEIVRSPHQPRIPAAVAGGVYTIAGRLIDVRGNPVGQPISFATIEIAPIEHLLTRPDDIQYTVRANLDDRITLLGYDLPQTRVAAGGALPVTLYWQAQQEMNTSYKVFVQLVDHGGALAQIDAIPAHWQRPTTGWVAGEILVDEYRLDIPQNAAQKSCRLIVGMYDERTLQRLNVLDQAGNARDDYILLADIDVELK